MSRFFSTKYKDLVPYTPGEQPKDRQFIKLNTNESPFPPSPNAISFSADAAKRLELYPDPTCAELVNLLRLKLDVSGNEILLTNGSDEILNFAFMAFCDETHPAVFCDITYGFYPVFAKINHVPFVEIPLKADFSVDVERFKHASGTIFLANPNAPTGLYLSLEQIEEIVAAHPDSVVVIDEAYIDFGGSSAVSLIHKYDNLLVTQTFSKSRSMAGARLGFGVGSKALIADLNNVKYSTNPYNINRMTMAAGLGALKDEAYTVDNCKTICDVRAYTAKKLSELGFYMTDSKANFLFVKHPKIAGKALYEELKSRGILIRHFDKSEITDYNRITIGKKEDMDKLILEIQNILEVC